MVLWPKLEDNIVAILGSDSLWVEEQGSILETNGNADIGREGSACEGSSDESGEMHYDWWKVW